MWPKVKILVGLLFIAFFFYGNPLKAQNPTMDAQWTVKKNNGSQLILELGIRTNTPHEHLGPATFIINFDHTSYVKFNGGSTGFADSGINYHWIDSFRPSVYTGDTTAVTQPSVGTININFNYSSGSAASISDSSDYTPVIDLIFAVSDATKSTNVTWNMNELSPPTMDNVFDDNINNPTNFDAGSFNGITVNTLPVTLLNFSAQLKNSETMLTGTPATEINNNYFTVERSTDGSNFTDLLYVNGAGNSDAKNNYTAYDEFPLSGVSYYRLSQTDFNGASKTFNMVAVNNANASCETLKITNIFTNPQKAMFSYSLPDDAPVMLIVTDIIGKIIHKEQVAGKKGVNDYNFSDAPTWKPGIYFITLQSQDQSALAKIVMP